MKILINFSPLKVGGGKNVAMNFLHSFIGMNLDSELFFLVAEDSEPHLLLKEMQYPNYFAVPSNPIKRILFEVFKSSAILRSNCIDIIYSYFGIGIFDKRIPQVSGSADSNLYFPEIDFWSDFSGLARLKKELIDSYRLWGVKRSTAVVFENEALETRSHELYKLGKTVVIKPSINFSMDSKQLVLPSGLDNETPKGLFLCGWHPNKNIMIIPEVAAKLKKRGVNFHFIITAPLDNSPMHKEFESIVAAKKVEDMVSVIGQVKKDELQSLYEQVSYVFLLSKLESFSNNIIESWFFRRPLIVTDAPWARSICGSAALYVERSSTLDIVEKVASIVSDAELQLMIVAEGVEKLKEYPTIEERINQEMEFLKHVCKNT